MVGKRVGESESIAWLLEAIRFRAWKDGSVLEDTKSLAKVAGISVRSAQRCLREALHKGLVREQDGGLVLDAEEFKRRDKELRDAGCQRVRVYARHLQDQDLKPIDRRILGWAELKGGGVLHNGSVFVVPREAMARELGIGTRSLNKRLSALGDRLEQRWRTCADGRMRRTSWVADRRQMCASETPDVRTGRGPLSPPDVRTTENRPGKLPTPDMRTTENPELRTTVSTPADPPEVSTTEASSQRVETGERPLRPGPGPQRLEEIRAVVERFRLEHDELDPGWIALLLEELGCNRPQDLEEGPPQRQQARKRALRRDLLGLANRACQWAGTVDDLCTFVIRVAKERGPKNLPGYLRACFRKGDPGCLLRSHKKNQIGRGAETWQDYSPETERALEGPHAVECGKLVAGLALLVGEEDGERRAQLRLELVRMLELGRQAAARAVLLDLVAKPRVSDFELALAVEGVMSVASARALLEFAA